jgi:hypothetical protein
LKDLNTKPKIISGYSAAPCALHLPRVKPSQKKRRELCFGIQKEADGSSVAINAASAQPSIGSCYW